MWYHHSSLIEIIVADLMANCQQKSQKRFERVSRPNIDDTYGGAILHTVQHGIYGRFESFERLKMKALLWWGNGEP